MNRSQLAAMWMKRSGSYNYALVAKKSRYRGYREIWDGDNYLGDIEGTRFSKEQLREFADDTMRLRERSLGPTKYNKLTGVWSYAKERKKAWPVGKVNGVKVVMREDMHPRGYIGMNGPAARQLKIDFPYDDNTVTVWAGLNAKEQKQTVIHEIDELKLMKKGLRYQEAHKRATRLENLKMKRRKVGGKSLATHLNKGAPALSI